MIDYKIIKTIAVLSDVNDFTTELNLISYNGKPAKYDIRKWYANGEMRKILKGITLTVDEMKELKSVLNAMEELQ